MTATIPGLPRPEDDDAARQAATDERDLANEGARARRANRRARAPHFLAHLALLLAAYLLWDGDRLDPQPPPRSERVVLQRANPNGTCLLVREDDSLVRLTKRWPSEAAIAHRNRWDGCRSLGMTAASERVIGFEGFHFFLFALVIAVAVQSLRPRKPSKKPPWICMGLFVATLGVVGAVALARDSVADIANDWMFLSVIASALVLGVGTIRGRFQWRLASTIAGVFALAYVVAEVAENCLLQDLLDGGAPNPWLRWIAAVKVGAVIAASPAFVASLAMSFADMMEAPKDPVAETPRKSFARALSFAKRWGNRVRMPTGRRITFETRRFEETVQHVNGGTPMTVGVCASGGGIRSAAFNLGALQSLSNAPDEMIRLRWLSAVSGGSYIAGAWVTARATKPAAWARHSEEEDHLRRNASYLAPGVGGKLWALTRYLFGFGINLGLVVLFLGAAALPIGWGVNHYQTDEPARAEGTIELPSGGCIERPNGTFAVAATGSELDVRGGATVELKRGVPVIEPTPDGAAAKDSDAPVDPEVSGPDTEASCAESMAALAAATTTLQTTTTIVTSGAAAGSSDESPVVAVPAATENRHLDRGSTVALDLDLATVPLAAGVVDGCVQRDTCGELGRVEVPRGSRLVSAAEALLVLADDVVVVDGKVFEDCETSACKQWDPPWWITAAVVLAALAAVIGGIGVVFTRLQPAQAAAAESWTRKLVVGAIAFAVTLEALPLLVTWLENRRRETESLLVVESVPGIVGAGSGVFLLAVATQAISFASGSSGGGASKWVIERAKSLWQRFRPLLLRVAVYVAGPVFVVGVAVLFATDAARASLRPSQLVLWLSIIGYLAVVLSAGDLNEWSLHPFYRQRLKVAFAADPVTLDCTDDDLLSALPEPPKQPELLVCAAANIADKRVTAPGRPVLSWVFSRSSMGNRQLGCIELDEPGSSRRLPTSMAHLDSTWASVAVSGAAFSPAMGKMTRAERMLLALANLRLGQWYPNPRLVGTVDPHTGRDWGRWYETHYPRPWYLAKEALGLHSAGDPWVYVTDGGHYENLGLVELVRRRCAEIYCFDAAGDSTDTFGMLADAARIARTELGVEIKVDTKPMKSSAEGISKFASSAGTVHYPAADGQPATTGWIVVAKLAVPEGGPFDIVDLARTLPSFPNHPTADQLYTDQKFEAYRALGEHLATDAIALVRKIRAYIDSPPEDVPAEEVVERAVAHTLHKREHPDPPPPEPIPGDAIKVKLID